MRMRQPYDKTFAQFLITILITNSYSKQNINECFMKKTSSEEIGGGFQNDG